MLNPFSALFYNNIEELERYLETGDVNIIDKNGCTLLHYAIKFKNNKAFSLLMNSYCDTKMKDLRGDTCVHYAVYHNCLGYLRIFLEKDVSLEMNNKGQTPLYLACRYGYEQLIDLFLEKYALDMGEKDEDKETLFLAFVRSKKVQLLRKYGQFEPWLEEPNYLGNTPLMIAVMLDSMEMTEFLLEYPIFINRKNHFRETALFFAVRNRNKRMIQLLLEKGSYAYFKNAEQKTIFDFADEEILDFLNQCLAKNGYRDYRKRYPLHTAIYDEKEVMMLTYMTLNYLNQEDDFGYTPWQLAELYENKFALKKLKELQREAKIATLKTKL